MTLVGPLRVSSRIAIAPEELRFRYVRSSGPGGQNVNKVNTKAELRWLVTRSVGMPDDVRARFIARFARRINARGELVITSQRYRDQPRNAADCLAKLREMLGTVAVAPKKRKKTRPTRAASEERLRQKRATSEKKQRRSPPQGD